MRGNKSHANVKFRCNCKCVWLKPIAYGGLWSALCCNLCCLVHPYCWPYTTTIYIIWPLPHLHLGKVPTSCITHYTPQETFARRRGRKPQLDPRTLNLDRLTGEENVTVVERGSGKKVRGPSCSVLYDSHAHSDFILSSIIITLVVFYSMYTILALLYILKTRSV